MSGRKGFTPKQRAERLTAWHHTCYLCKTRIWVERGEKYEIHHIVEYAFSRDDRIKNTPPVHRPCHKEWTVNHSIPVVAKSNRQRDKHQRHIERMAAKLTEITAPEPLAPPPVRPRRTRPIPSRPMQGTRRSGISKKLNGTIERMKQPNGQ